MEGKTLFTTSNKLNKKSTKPNDRRKTELLPKYKSSIRKRHYILAKEGSKSIPPKLI